MSWSLDEAIDYYRSLGAPGDQSVLISLLREIQGENGGAIPAYMLEAVSKAYGIKAAVLHVLIKRIPSLRLKDRHCLELCGGPNCGKHQELSECAQNLLAQGARFELKYVPCMRMCGKGPNLRWDGTLFNRADPALLVKLVEESE